VTKNIMAGWTKPPKPNKFWWHQKPDVVGVGVLVRTSGAPRLGIKRTTVFGR
jgi:hypothetical protein